MAACLCVWSSFVIRSNHPKSEPRKPVFGGKGLHRPLWLQQAELEVWVPSPQPSATGLAGGGWIAATVLKAKIHHYQLQLTSQDFPWKLQVLK